MVRLEWVEAGERMSGNDFASCHDVNHVGADDR